MWWVEYVPSLWVALPQHSARFFCSGKRHSHLQLCAVHAPVQPWLGKRSTSLFPACGPEPGSGATAQRPRWVWSSYLAQSTPYSQILAVPFIIPIRAWDYFFILNFYYYYWVFLNCQLQRTKVTVKLFWQHWTSQLGESKTEFYYPHVLLRKPRCMAGLQHYTCIWGCGDMGAGELEFSGSVGYEGLVTKPSTGPEHAFI